jgi:hypothetical protein
MEPFKMPEDLNTNRNGFVMSTTENEESIGMPDQKQNMVFNTGEEMVRGGTDPSIFDNNGGTDKGEGAGTINKNGEYGPITYGF